jgi:N-acetylglutamate synthase-like GNAT family acetyltransferase
MLVQNKNDSRRFEINFIKGEHAAYGAVQCMLSTYGKDNYFNPDMLDEQRVKSSIRDNSLETFIGETENRTPVITLSARINPFFEQATELCALAINNEHRGFNLGSAIINHLVSEYNEALLLTRVIILHKAVANILEAHGFVPFGFKFGAINGKTHLSELNLKSQKLTFAVYVRNNGQSTVKPLYIPEKLTQFTRERYSALGITAEINCKQVQPCAETQTEYLQDEYNHALSIFVFKCGQDLTKRIGEIEKSYTSKLQTIDLYLNINEPSAVYGYEALVKAGYKFAGLMPLCGEYEYIIMSKLNDVFIDTSELAMTKKLTNVFERIIEL